MRKAKEAGVYPAGPEEPQMGRDLVRWMWTCILRRFLGGQNGGWTGGKAVGSGAHSAGLSWGSSM